MTGDGTTESQWGHVAIDVEIDSATAAEARRLAEVSMGPRRDRRGNRPVPAGVPQALDVSMGPRRDRRGNVINRKGHRMRTETSQWGHVAIDVEMRRLSGADDKRRAVPVSMGPRRDRRGNANPRTLTQVTASRLSLNGATSRSTWKYKQNRTDCRRIQSVSIGPRRDRRGNHHEAPLHLRAEPRVSMGPRRDRRGNADLRRRLEATTSPGLNGATSRSTWK